ncbi:MAG: AAA family ATPase [Phycisphaerales bacterium]|nr:AAA family ATPase [Phycisphaerales bacterium]
MSAATTPTPPVPMPRPPMGGPQPSAGGGVLDPVRLVRQYYVWLVGAGALGVMLGVAAYLVLRMVAPSYQSVLNFEVRPLATEVGQPGGSVGQGGRDELDTYIDTQAFVLTSDRILERALRERDVQSLAWAQGFVRGGVMDDRAALRELRDNVKAARIRDSGVIRLMVSNPDMNAATVLANAIGAVYVNDNVQQSGATNLSNIETLNRKVNTLREDVRAIDRQTETLLGNNQITALNQQTTVWYTEIVNLQPQIVRLSDQIASLSERLGNSKKLQEQPGVPVYPQEIIEQADRSTIAQQMESQIANLRATMQAALEEFGPEHRDVRRIERQIRSLEAERQKAIDRERVNLFQLDLEQQQRSIDSLEASRKALVERLTEAQRKLAEVTLVLKQLDDLRTERDQKNAAIAKFSGDIDNLTLLNLRGQRVRMLGDAAAPDGLSFPKPVPVVLICTLLIPGLVGGLIVLKELREQRIRSPQDVALIPRTRLLGFLPELEMDPTAPPRIETAALDRPEGAVAESVRQLRINLLKAMSARGHRTVVFAAGMPGSGTTSLLSNLAANLSAIDQKVLVIDANLRRPALHRVLGGEEGPGLAEVLTGNAAFEAAARPTALPGVTLLPAGRDRKGVHERLTTPAMAQLLRQARERFDIVLIDAPPAVVSGDALAIAGQADASVLVIRAFSEKRGLVTRLRSQMGDAHAEFLGVVINAVRPSAGGYLRRNFETTQAYSETGKLPPGVTMSGNPPA